MTRRIRALPVIFISISSLVFILGMYLLLTKSSLQPQLFITACGEVLKNISQHVHFNPVGLLSPFILLIAIVGVCLAIFQTIRFILSYRKLSATLQILEKVPEKLLGIIQRQDLHDIPFLVISGGPTAYTIGLLKPRIVISQLLINKATDKQLEAIVLHELYHLKNRHLLWLFISRLISSLFFFVPLIAYLAQQLKTEFEMMADSYVVSKQKSREYLCGSLALNLQYASGVIPHFATSPIEKRVDSLFSHKVTLDKVSSFQFSISLLSIMAMIGIALTQPTQIEASFIERSEATCTVGVNCQNTDCSDQFSSTSPVLSSAIPASFLFSTSY